jgi:hypothetical protein
MRTPIFLGLVVLVILFLCIPGCTTTEQERSWTDQSRPREGYVQPDFEVSRIPDINFAPITIDPRVPAPVCFKLPDGSINCPDSTRENEIQNETVSERIPCGENLCPTGWICCTNIKICHNPKEQIPSNCASGSGPNQNNLTRVSQVVSQYAVSGQPTPYPVCANMPDGSTKCPEYGGSWKTVQTPSILSYAVR